MTTPQLPDLDIYDHFFGYARGTTGGEGGRMVTCKTAAEVNALLKDKPADEPVIVYLPGAISAGGADEIEIKDTTNVTIMGDGASKTMEGFGVKMMRAKNIILFNLSIGKVNLGPKDAIGMETDCERIVALHCDLYGDMAKSKDYYDGCFDGKRGTEKYAIVLCNTHDHHKAWLQGYSDSDVTPDAKREFTAALNLVKNVGSRCPSVRYGVAHVWGNVFEDVETSVVNARMGAEIAVEKNTFIRCKNPVMGDMSKTVGKWNLIDNLMQDCTWGKDENGQDSDNAQDGKSTTDYYPPYRMPNWTREQCAAFAREFAGLLPPGKAVTMPDASDQPIPEQPQQPVEEQPDPVEQPSDPETPAEPEQPETEQPVDAGELLDRAVASLQALRPFLTPAPGEQDQAPAGGDADILVTFDALAAAVEQAPDSKNGNKKEVLSYLKRGREQAVKMLGGG
ncbi:hypothetical protein [Roseomonas chloroacetimidivorans]|uniref:pectate lyase family protein n=1 Tax=Roseomonas chloroacetimidivorans TaxID=1766656 RepID=UPI003C7939D3